MSGNSEIVVLNVSGFRIEALRSTLTKFPESLLGQMFKHGSDLCPMTKGAYFVDRNPSTFQQVLNYLRTDELDSNVTTVGELKELLLEAQYFVLDELKAKLQDELSGKDDSDTTLVFIVGGCRQMIQKSIFGNIPKNFIGEVLKTTLGQDMFVDAAGNIHFHSAEVFSILVNSMSLRRDVTYDVAWGTILEKAAGRISCAVKLLLFFKKNYYSTYETVCVELKSTQGGVSISESQDVPKKVLRSDPDSKIAKLLTSWPHNSDLNSKGDLVLATSTQTLQKMRALLEVLKTSGTVDMVTGSRQGDRVDEMSQLGREVGLLSNTKLFAASQFHINSNNNFVQQQQQPTICMVPNNPRKIVIGSATPIFPEISGGPAHMAFSATKRARY
eukprot:TRINITY_DN8863_c0_g1_i2.p1 TRINITY_DN8863_c0_g1~~TRINITY_DN8863_c0_g1_i2.p1  ORF type:complete len:386 (+),score=112.05 TRINITY_DN8863_c0_g1_i2:37-1194(+)